MRKVYRYFTAFLLLHIAAGCAVTTSNLQQVDVAGPVYTRTAKITDGVKENGVTLRGNLSFNINHEMNLNTGEHTFVNENGEYEVEEVPGSEYFREVEGANIHEFKGNNFRWSSPDVQGMIEGEYTVTSHFSVLAGLNLSGMDDRTYWGQSLGVAFFSATEENVAIRVDAGINRQEMSYNAEYVIKPGASVTGDDNLVRIVNKEDNQTLVNYAVSLTINTKFPDSPVNFFGSLSLGYQQFYDFDSKYKSNGFVYSADDPGNYEFSKEYGTFSAGLWTRLGSSVRLVSGVRLNRFYDSGESTSMPAYFIQMDYDLFD